MELFIFGRFHAREGQESVVEAGVREVVRLTREEPGCLSINGFRSLRDPRLFYIHAHWTDVDTFEVHARQPHTRNFLKMVELLIDHPLDITRSEVIG